MLGSYRGQRAGAMLRDILIWLALGLGIVMLYIYKDDLMPIGAHFLRPHVSQPWASPSVFWDQSGFRA